MSRNVHKMSNTIASAARADYSRFLEPADSEFLYKFGARSFYVEQRDFSARGGSTQFFMTVSERATMTSW